MVKLYFAYGSNLCKKQMMDRCKNSKSLENYYLNDHKLCFCWNGLSTNPNGVANIIKETGSKVPGVIYEISKSDEDELDRREGFNLTPKVYIKKYFRHKDQNVLFYILNKKCDPREPKESYWKDKIYQGYKDHQLDTKYLKEALNNFDIKLIGE
jgi:gamma-glutamylcyclotransferase (GGCT)/AIG2-like uncharacterized protein YtfP